MAIQALLGPIDGDDIHLVPGMLSPWLLHRMVVNIPDPDKPGETKQVRADSPDLAGATVIFTPELTDPLAGHNISFVSGTGEVKMTGPPVGDLRSFQVTGSVIVSATERSDVRIRVHVHEAIEALWLTPNPLTVRQGAENVRLTVTAKFTDGVIGDVTNWGATDPLRHADDMTFARIDDGTNTPWLRWSGTSASVGVDAKTGILKVQIPLGDFPVSVAVGTLAAPRTANASVRTKDPWASPVIIEEVGDTSDVSLIDDRTNVLILPDGFVHGEKQAFKNLAGALVGVLKTHPLTRPYDLFASKLNFFSAWVESREKGVSVLNDTRRADGSEVPLPVPDTDPTKPYGLETLIDKVGLPTPKLDKLGPGVTMATYVARWQAQFGNRIDPARVTQPVFNKWIALADHVLVDEVDTAFHTAFGAKPRAETSNDGRSMDLNPHRGASEDDFDRFLGGLQRLGDPTPLRRWGRKQPDERNVIILTRSRRSGGAADHRDGRKGHARRIVMALDDNTRHQLKTATTGGVALTADSIPATIPTESWLTVAHEVAHTWDLEDEYKEHRELDAILLGDIFVSGNVEARETLLVPAAGGKRTLDIAALKWTWPRIAACGVLTHVPTALAGAPTNYLLQLRRGEVRGPDAAHPAFTIGDIVRLRRRPLLGNPPDPTKPPIPSQQNPPSAQLIVTFTDTTADTLTVADPAGGTPPDLTKFLVPKGTESIVIRPTVDATGRELGMVSQTVLDQIHHDHNPLNAAAGAPADRDWAKEPIPEDSPTPTRNFSPAAPNPPIFSSWIVGLFEEGAEAEKDVYRPTGICLMRNFLIQRFLPDGRLNTAREQAYQFCPVCRYVMVDRVDPAQHGAIDAKYEKRYVR